MTHFLKLPLFLSLLGLLPACGKFQEKFGRLPAGETRVSFAIPHNPSAAGTLIRGVMIYIYSVDPAGFSTTVRLNDETQLPPPLVVPNGVYKVFSLGWDGASVFQVSGNGIRCGLGNGGTEIPLSGGSATVQLTMTNSACGFGNSAGTMLYPANAGGAGFTQSGAPGGFFATTLRMCSDASVTGGAGSTTYCTTVTTTYLSQNATVALVGYVKNGGVIQELGPNSSMVSSCLSASGGLVALGNIPFGNPNIPGPFFTRVTLYNNADTTCSGAAVKVLDFTEGVGRTSISTSPTTIFSPETTTNSLLLNMGS